MMLAWRYLLRNLLPKLFAMVVGTILLVAMASAEPLSLRTLVTPSSVIEKNGKVITFAIHGYIEFRSLSQAFAYIDSQRQRWEGKISEEENRELAVHLLGEAVESRVISMADERPLEALVTHTSEELRRTIAEVQDPVPAGYLDAFLAVQTKWKYSLNCWSAAPSIPARVLSNWYPIEEGIELHGAVYDSTEHFWQAVKYHPDTTIEDLRMLTLLFESRNWQAWLKRLDEDPQLYLADAYAVEFLRYNLTAQRMRWFREQLATHGLRPGEHVRQVQQRGSTPFRFSAFEEKVIWGDLADVFHLVYVLSLPDDPMRRKLSESHLDGIYLDGAKLGFISEEFRVQMFEIWKVKFLKMTRFREVIVGIPPEIRLEHFLNDGDSPDIPIPVYVGYLNEIREMARRQAATN